MSFSTINWDESSSLTHLDMTHDLNSHLADYLQLKDCLSYHVLSASFILTILVKMNLPFFAGRVLGLRHWHRGTANNNRLIAWAERHV